MNKEKAKQVYKTIKITLLVISIVLFLSFGTMKLQNKEIRYHDCLRKRATEQCENRDLVFTGSISQAFGTITGFYCTEQQEDDRVMNNQRQQYKFYDYEIKECRK